MWGVILPDQIKLAVTPSSTIFERIRHFFVDIFATHRRIVQVGECKRPHQGRGGSWALGVIRQLRHNVIKL